MIKRITLLVRKENTTPSGFRDYWHEKHGKIVLQMPAVAAYLQNPVVANHLEDVGDGPAFQFDGIVELWFVDEAAQKLAFASEAAKQLPLDEPNFIRGITILTIDEHQLRAGIARTKAMIVLNLPQRMRNEETVQALLAIEAQAASLPGIARLVANRVIGTGKRDGLWSEPVPPGLILEMGAETPTAMTGALQSEAFETIRARIRDLRGRLAVRIVEERRVI
jgi:uncharacterized protein (TIGR02118 family)